MVRHHVCDVPGCVRERLRWQRLCNHCFAALPGDIRTGIKDSHAQRRRADHRRECRRAAEYLAGARPPPNHHITPQQAFANSERLLGEH